MKNKLTFTLLEVLISIFILSLIIVSVSSILYLGNLNWQRNSILLDLYQQTRIALDGMAREIRQAKSSTIAISAGGSKVDFSIPKLTGGTYDISYYLDTNSSRILREYPTGTTRILVNNVNSLNFSLSGNTLTIAIQVFKNFRGNSISFNLAEEVKLRNE